MSSILPPFDKIPKSIPTLALQGKAVIDAEINKLFSQVELFIKNVTKLPKNCDCNDPRIQQVKKQLKEIQRQITVAQQAIGKINATVSQIRSLVATANAIRTAIIGIQILNPTTAAAFVATQNLLLQDNIIVNAMASLQTLTTIPTDALNKLSSLVPMIANAITQIGQACSGDVDSLNVSQDVLSNITGSGNSSSNEFSAGSDTIVNRASGEFNSKAPSEFYNEYNVSDIDLFERANTIQSLLEQQITQQTTLLKSLEEAPSVVYRGSGVPDPKLGKAGDMYFDTLNNKIYGPKLNSDSWLINVTGQDNSAGGGQQVDPNINPNNTQGS